MSNAGPAPARPFTLRGPAGRVERSPGRAPPGPVRDVVGVGVADLGGDVGGTDGGRLAHDAVVDVASEPAVVRTRAVLDRLDRELVGLRPVKARLGEIGDLLVVDRLRQRFGIESPRPTLHMCFTGSPGTGKTTVAVRMAELLHGLGYLARGHLVTVTRDDLVGQYIGHTAPKTKEVVARAMGGVLFIDEAYYLHRRENERDYGQETIEILLQVMENQRDDLVVILAGYEDRMGQFFQSNPGMESRIAHHIHFPDYPLDELVQLGELMIGGQQYELSADARARFRSRLDVQMREPRFANGRSVRNALEQARLRQAARIVAEGRCDLRRSDLVRLEACDIGADAEDLMPCYADGAVPA